MKKKQETFPMQYTGDTEKMVGLIITKGAMAVLMATPPHEKGARKKVKRLIRIRKNVFREIRALNKELMRHTQEEVMS